MSLTHHETIGMLENVIQMQNQLTRIIAELLGSRTLPEAYQSLSHFAPLLFPNIEGALYLRNGARDCAFERVITWGGFKRGKRVFTQDQCRALHLMTPYFVENQQRNGIVCKHVEPSDDSCCLC